VVNRWGKAGVRLTDEQAAHCARTAVATRNRREVARTADNAVAYRLWRAGEVKPYLITQALDARALWGPQVDIECGAKEPDVDLWEAGKLYPTWRQLLLLAQLCETNPRRLCEPRNVLTVEETSMRFHHFIPEQAPRVWSYDVPVVQATVGDAPFEIPETRR
jgi:hypothetical protein